MQLEFLDENYLVPIRKSGWFWVLPRANQEKDCLFCKTVLLICPLMVRVKAARGKTRPGKLRNALI